MKCTICGHSTMPGAMLCGPCRAALKRARYMSVQVVSPSSMMQGRSRRSRATAATLAAPKASRGAAKVLAAHTGATTPVTPAARAPIGLVRAAAMAMLAVAGLGVVAWLGQFRERDAGPAAVPPVSRRVIAVHVDPVVVDPGTSAPQASRPGPASVLVASSVADDAPSPWPSRTRAPRIVAPTPARGAGAAMVASTLLVDAYEMVPEPPRPAPAVPLAVPSPPPPPPPDRWHTMRESLARCDREGGFGGFICDQRVRLDSCEGFWGRVPQCPLPPENPR